MSEWNSEKIEQYFKNIFDPMRAEKLARNDPVGRLIRTKRALLISLAGMKRKAHEAVLDPASRDQLRTDARAANEQLSRIDAALAEIALLLTSIDIGDPTVSAVKARIAHLQAHCRPTHKGSQDHSAVDAEIARLQAIIGQIEVVATG